MTYRAALLSVAALVAASPVAAHAATALLRRGLADATFYPGGYNGASDTVIFYYSPNPDHASYPQQWMRASDGGTTTVRSIVGPSSLRTLFRYDLSAMNGQGVTVSGDATLTLTSAGGLTGATYLLYQIAAENAGWVESTNVLGLNPNNKPTLAHDGDPTWWFKSINTEAPNSNTTLVADDTTSVPWASGQKELGPPGSNPEGYANTGGLWNPIDLVDQDLDTPVTSYLDMFNLDAVAEAVVPDAEVAVSFTIPQAMVQSWIDNPAANAGLYGRYLFSSTSDFYSSERGSSGSPLRPTLQFEYTVATNLPGDFNHDDSVDVADLEVWTQQFGTTFDGADLLLWQRNLGSSLAVAAAGAVPEPTSVLLLVGAVAGQRAWRRRMASFRPLGGATATGKNALESASRFTMRNRL